MSLKSFFKSIGHGITNAVEDVAHGVEQGAKDIAKGVEGAVEHGVHAFGDVLQGDFRGGLHELGQAGKAVGDTAKAEFKLGLTVGGAMTDLALGTVADAHLSKGLTKLAETAKGGLDKARDAVDKSLNQVVDSAEGAVAGGMRCVDDVAHGRFDRLGKDSLSVAGNAFNLCTSLTPEGMVANVGANLTRSFMDGTPLSKYANVIGDTMARKPLWMLRDGAKDVAEPFLDPLKKDLASADAAVNRTLDKAENGISGTLDKAENGISRTLAEAAVASGLAVQGGMTAQSQTPQLSEAQEDAIARQLADAMERKDTQSGGQDNLSTQDGRGDTPLLSEAQEDAIAGQLADALNDNLSTQDGRGDTPQLSEAQEDAIAGQLADALNDNLSTQDGRGDTPQLSEAQEDAIARQLADAMEGKDKQSGREEGLLASLFGEPALSASADVSFQLHTV
ncbi:MULTISPECIES: hypothetical protein [Xanthomonas translucens group]|uniref:hypothetical protein n=2 Tax=Xanthomonas TaxID=338 RepID=UPI00071BA73B|nr:hypothetical protein [Xanthomonas translucens]